MGRFWFRPSTKKSKKTKFMKQRPRRNRRSDTIRRMIKETQLSVNDLVYPLFLVPGEKVKDQIISLPIAYRMSIDTILKEIAECIKLGLNQFILFPSIPEVDKDTTATYSYQDNNFYLTAAKTIKSKYPKVCLISDVAMDPYSSDGHDGLVRDGHILNDESLPILAKMAVAQAQSGFDIIAPSDMMDGRVAYIRNALDEAGYSHIGIMSYTAKYASAFYGPFRDALDSAPKAGDKKTYQMDPANSREALLEGDLDVAEGADFIMVKPAIHYLDIISKCKRRYNTPIAAYHVSGECAQLLAASRLGWLDYDSAMPEAVLSIKRAGADIIITYFAKEVANLLSHGKV